MLVSALAAASEDKDPLASKLSLTVSPTIPVPDPFDPESIHALEFAHIQFEVAWPLNIVINARAIVAYNKVMHLFLRLRRSAWALADVWAALKADAPRAEAADLQRFRAVQLYRHEMQHFVTVITEYFCHETLEVCWAEFQASIARPSVGLEQLRQLHDRYLQTILLR